MDIQKARLFDNKKFMWDGVIYQTEEEALVKKVEYEKENFEITMINNEGKYLLYTRRMITEVVVEGAAPA